MKAPIEHIRVSAQAREQLIKLKRSTGIKNWNVLCRWAFCVSLNLKERPIGHDIKADSNIEMSWKVFAGETNHII
jgi:DNA sulfur modification protein DndE